MSSEFREFKEFKEFNAPNTPNGSNVPNGSNAPNALTTLITNIKFAGRINKKQKSSISTALSGKRGIRTPGTVARTPHFECGPFDHSGIFPMRFAVANVRIYFLIATIYIDILHFFCEIIYLE